MHRVFVTQLLKQGAAIKSRKQRDSTCYSGAFEVRLCSVLFCLLAVLNPPMFMPISDEQEHSCFCRRLAAGRGSGRHLKAYIQANGWRSPPVHGVLQKIMHRPTVSTDVKPVEQPVECLFTRCSRLFNRGCQTAQVVDNGEQPVGQLVECLYTRCSRLSNQLSNRGRFDSGRFDHGGTF